MKINHKIELYTSLYSFLTSEGLRYLEEKSFDEESKIEIKKLISHLPNPDLVKVEEHFIISFAWEVISGYLESLYWLEFNKKPLHLYAKMLIDEVDENGKEINRDKKRRYLTDEDIYYVRTHYSNYAKYITKSFNTNRVVTQTDTGLELSFLMYEQETKSVIYPLSKQAHVIVGGDDTKKVSLVTENIINSIQNHYKSDEVTLLIASNHQEKFKDDKAYFYNNQEVIKDIDTLLQSLSDLEKVMLDRFSLFQTHKARDIKMFNYQANTFEKIPYIVVLIEDIQMDGNENKKRFEDLIIRLTQRSRSAGIHLVMLTSDPHTYVSKEYTYFIPNRLAFKISQPYQSKALLGNDSACYIKYTECLIQTF